MRFSIITTTFNAETFLKEALDSIFMQEGVEFEHILWDGGSTDKTLEIASQYPTKIYQGLDKGIGDGMNKGASFAKGEILLHLHADDLLYHGKVLANVDLLFKQYPRLRWLYGRCVHINERGETKGLSSFQAFSIKRLKKYNCISHPSTFIERSLFEETGGFDPTLRYCMDYDLWLRLAMRSQPQAFPFIFSCFRKHTGSLSTREVLGVADEAYLVRSRYVKDLIGRLRSYRTWKRRRKYASD